MHSYLITFYDGQGLFYILFHIFLAGSGTLDAGRWTLDAGRWTLDAGRWTLDAGRREGVPKG